MNILFPKCTSMIVGVRVVRWLCTSSSRFLTPQRLMSICEDKYEEFYDQTADSLVNEHNVFANKELSLKYMSVYGFDFDYTLIQYRPGVLQRIYDLAKERMVDEFSYPCEIKKLEYDPDFAIRGLHLDIRKGLLMKMDSYHHIQLGSVHCGRTLVPNEEVIELYGGTHVPLYIMDDHLHRSGLEGKFSSNMTQFLDRFSNPEATLFADISEFLNKESIPFDSEYLYADVEKCIKDVHHSSIIHNEIAQKPECFIENSPDVLPYLNDLKNSGKKLFLLTNSPFWFVDKGMCYVTKSEDWRDLFDVVVCSARKPSFYSGVNRPFRSLNPGTNSPSWKRVTELKPGTVYNQGNIKEFVELTGWKGSDVLYIGDHVYSDLTDPNLQLGWNTVAIIPELDAEIKICKSDEYKKDLASLLAIESMLKEVQGNDFTPEVREAIDQWRKKRAQLRKSLKDIFNPYFGSIFRTERGPTYFSRRLMRFASLYTSSLSNFKYFSLNHTFYSRRSALAHEPDINFDSKEIDKLQNT